MQMKLIEEHGINCVSVNNVYNFLGFEDTVIYERKEAQKRRLIQVCMISYNVHVTDLKKILV